MKKGKLKGFFAKRRNKDAVFYALLLFLPVLQFCIFYIGVNVNSILLAFKRYGEDGKYHWSGLENFRTLFTNFRELTVFRVGFRNSMIVFVAGTVIGITLGILFSYYIYKKAPFKNFFKVMLFLPSIIPSIALVVMYKQITDGAVPALFETFGLTVSGLLANPKTTFGTLLFYNIWVGFGVSVLLYVGAMTNISESVVEAAKIDGVGYFTELRFITIPLIWDTMSTFIITAVGGIFVNQAYIYAFYSDGAEERITTIGYWLYKETVKPNGFADYPMLSAFGLLLSFVTIPLVYLVRYLLSQKGADGGRKRRVRHAVGKRGVRR